MESKYYKRSNGDYARLGRFMNISSPMFGKYYIDLQTVSRSHNDNGVPCGESKKHCEAWLEENGFIKAY